MSFSSSLPAQTLLNIDFGVGSKSAKVGFAATGQATNDFWNLYRHYDPKFLPGTPLVADGKLEHLKLADGTDTKIAVAVANAPGVWGNSTGDPMYDTYIFAQNGSNITVTLTGLEPGRYHFYAYGHADPDVTGEQNSVFTVRSGTNVLGPAVTLGSSGWKAGQPWQERSQYVVFRDVPVLARTPVVIEVAPGVNGVAVLNGLQVSSRGTSPPKLIALTPPRPPAVLTNLLFHEIRYDGKVTDTDARFAVDLHVESMTTNEISAPLFEGEVAVIAPDLPVGLRIASSARKYRLIAIAPGVYRFKLELVAKIAKAEPWNQISFTGPEAAIAAVTAQAAEAGVEMQLLSGTQIESGTGASSVQSKPAGTGETPVLLSGFLGADRLLSLRWQSKAAEVTRKSLVTVDTLANAQVTPTVIKYATQLRYEILQAGVPRLSLALPKTQTLTQLQGEQIRDWSVKPDTATQRLTIEFIKPIKKSYSLTLYSEQTVEATAQAATLVPPQPLDIERESGSFTVSTDDMLVEVETAAGLRQVNASTGALAAYRFYGRPITLSARLKRIEPVLKVADRVAVRLEETRLLLAHGLTLTVEKAGIYAVELAPQAGFTVADVRGEGVDDWKVADGKLRVSFASRVLGPRKLDVQLEQALKEFPSQLTVLPLRVPGATNETSQVGAAAALGLRLKTAGELLGLREMPVSALSSRADEQLAYRADQGDWRLTLAVERLPARIVAEVFNLLTVGDGLVGGSATIRYGLVNQGVQEFRVRLPAHWRNVEFTGPNIRRKETNAPAAGAVADTNYVIWAVTLQDKAWGGYTLVITYDYQFDPKQATLDLRGAHCVGVERETGSVALTSAASLKLEPRPAADPLRLIDPSELAETDRALITRPVLLAWRYTGDAFTLAADVTRHQELPVLDAVADHTQLTSVLTEEGEMLTQASFMVKNNDRQFQRFALPQGAKFWGCYVNNQPAKAESDGRWLLVSLPRGANRDDAFAVDIVYAQKFAPLKARLWPDRIQLAAPKTDVPNTYAEWQVFVPSTQKVGGFGGNMTVARGTVYGLREAWQRFTGFYREMWRDASGAVALFGGIAIVLLAIVGGVIRRGFRGAAVVLSVCCILAVIAAMVIPNFVMSRKEAAVVKLSVEKGVTDIAGLGVAPPLEPPPPPAQLAGAAVVEKNLPVNGIRVNGDRLAETKEAAGKEVVRAGIPADERAPRFGSEGDFKLPAGGRGGHGGGFAGDPPTLGRMFAAGGAINGPVATTTSGVSGWGAAPTAAGLRSIRIEVPRSGRPFSFTKVLNVSDEPLSVRISVIKHNWFERRRAALQLAAFLVGLVMAWREWRRQPVRTFRVSIGLALALGAVISLMLTHRTLHLALIAAAPVLGLLLIGWLGWKFWPRRRQAPAPEPASHPTAAGSSPTTGTATAAIALALILCALGSASAKDAEASDPSAIRNPQSAILSASYAGTVSEKVAQFDCTLALATFSTNQIVPLFGDEVAVQDFSTKAADARLLRQGRMVALRLAEATNATLQFKLVVKLGGDVSKRQLAFGIPPALASQITMTLEEPEAEVEFPTAISFRRAPGAQQTRVEAVLGAGDRVEMTWTPRMKRATEMAASVFVENTALLTVGGGVVNTRATLAYQIAQGELRQVKVRLPAGQRLLRVEGEFVRTWELRDEAGGQVLTVDLVKAVSPSYRLTVETERLLEKLPAALRLELPHALEVIRETGLVGLRGTEELNLAVEETPDLQRLDASEFARASSVTASELVSAYRFLKPGFALAARAEAVQAQIEAVAWNTFRVGFDDVSLSARVDYTIRKAGVFTLRLTLPVGYRVENVAAGVRPRADSFSSNEVPATSRSQLQWSEKNGALEITLKERTQGAFTLSVSLLKAHKELPKTLDLAGVQPLDVQKLTGFVSVSAEPGVAVKTTAFEGLTEIPAAALGQGRTGGTPVLLSSVLAYKFVGTDAQAPPWKLSLATEVVESWVRAEVANVVTVTETLASGRVVVRYDIANAPVKEFRLRVPAAVTNVEVLGANIRRRDRTNEVWTVELQTKVRGIQTFTATWEQPRTGGTNVALALAGVEALGVERETGFVVLLAKPPMQVEPKAATDELIRIDARELPDWAGVPSSATASGEVPVLVYRYLRPGWRLTSEARRFEEAAVLQALVDSARLTTVVADDGQMMTELALSVRNNGLQHLEIELPPAVKVWSAFVAGQPVRPTQRAGKLLLPLDRSAGDAPVSVDLTYVGADRFPKTKGKVHLASPRLAVPLKNARWEVYLPPDYDYSRFEGTMTHELSAAPVVQAFSSREYLRQEVQKKEARKAEVKNILSKSRRELTEGKLKDVNIELGQAARLNEAAADEETRQEVERLKRDLSKVQSSNLIQAQRAYSLDNTRRFGGPAPQMEQAGKQDSQAQQAAELVQYDAEAAERQVLALNRAQEVSVATVQLLRASLPTRGVRHAFTQVLQTEVDKAMTIQFSARNTKEIGWFKRLVYGAGAFLMLWIFVSVVSARRRVQSRTAAV